MIAIVAVAVMLFTIPLAITVRNLTIADELGELEHAATRAERTVSPGVFAGTDAAELPARDSELQLAIYDARGRRRAGDGPARLEPFLRGVYQGRTVNHRGGVVSVAFATRRTKKSPRTRRSPPRPFRAINRTGRRSCIGGS